MRAGLGARANPLWIRHCGNNSYSKKRKAVNECVGWSWVFGGAAVCFAYIHLFMSY